MNLKTLLFSGLAAGLFFSADAENILAGKTAVFEQKPGYHLTADANDAKNLTDGKIENWLIWNYKTSVGWERGKQYSFYFDLGEEMPIGKIRLHTSAGRNGVKLPKSIHVYAGNSLSEFAQIDEMIKPNRHLKPEAPGAKTTFWIDGKNCPVIARYLKFVVTPSATKEAYFFLDEITVERGGELNLTDSGKAVAETMFKRHTLLTEFLTKLGVCEETAAKDACKIEHVISEESFEAIKKSIKR